MPTSNHVRHGQHYTRSTVSASAYCGKCGKVTQHCGKVTQHRVDDRRKGPCLECIAKLETNHAKTPIEQDISQGQSRLLFGSTVKVEDRLIKCGSGLHQELDAILREEFEERAAIKEFLGNIPREQAETEAREEIEKRK